VTHLLEKQEEEEAWY